MDISISRLNNRIALQVPNELPLSLVFITGQVQELAVPAGTSRYASFTLADGGFFLHSRVLRQVVEETMVEEGDRVRVSGQLVFDRQAATYILLARNLEVLSPEPASKGTMQAILPDIQKRAAATSLIQTEIPAWVRKLAPPEVQQEMGLVEQEEVETEPADALVNGGNSITVEGGTPKQLPKAMLDFLSSAIDSADDIELTPDMISEYIPEVTKRMKAPQKNSSPVLPPPVVVTPEAAPRPEPEPEVTESEEPARVKSPPPPIVSSSAPSSLLRNLSIFLILVALVLFIVVFLFLTLSALGAT